MEPEETITTTHPGVNPQTWVSRSSTTNSESPFTFLSSTGGENQPAIHEVAAGGTDATAKSSGTLAFALNDSANKNHNNERASAWGTTAALDMLEPMVPDRGSVAKVDEPGSG